MKHKCLVYLSAKKHFLFQVKIKRYDQFVVKIIQKKPSKFSSKCLYLKKFLLPTKIFFTEMCARHSRTKLKKPLFKKSYRKSDMTFQLHATQENRFSQFQLLLNENQVILLISKARNPFFHTGNPIFVLIRPSLLCFT